MKCSEAREHSCGQKCGRVLKCGNHTCQKECHTVTNPPQLNEVRMHMLHTYCMCAFVCMCVHVCVCICVHVCACVHVCMCVHVYVCMCVHVCMCACMHVCACVCMCVHVCMCACLCMYCMHVCVCMLLSVCEQQQHVSEANGYGYKYQ